MKADAIGTCLAIWALCSAAGAAPERGVHQFMELAISPDGRHVASVEGDASPFGGQPVIRSLVIRTTDGSHALKVALPCGEARECWPSSPAWRAGGEQLVFALRTPGTHARSVYEVSADGSHLAKLLAFDGTVGDLRPGPDGGLAVLAVAGAVKEVGATQAGAPITGDLGGPVPEQRIGILESGRLHWASPAGMWVYQYDWLPNGSGFVGTAAMGDGDRNWWIAKLYAFDAKAGTASVIYAPPDMRHQIADPVVSPDGKTVAFISGIMSDFGSTGGDIYTVPADGGTASNLTPGLHASARSIAFGCDGRLRAELLAGPETQFATFSPGLAVVWHGSDTVSIGRNGGLWPACPSQLTAAAHESFNHAYPRDTHSHKGYIGDTVRLGGYQQARS